MICARSFPPPQRHNDFAGRRPLFADGSFRRRSLFEDSLFSQTVSLCRRLLSADGLFLQTVICCGRSLVGGRSADGFFLRATRFVGSPARSGASCSGQKGSGDNTLVCAGRLVASHLQYARQESLQHIADLRLNLETAQRNMF